MSRKRLLIQTAVILTALTVTAASVCADDDNRGNGNGNGNGNGGSAAGLVPVPSNNSSCAGLPSYTALKTALVNAVAAESSGLNNQMWATLVDRNGVVCAVAFSGTNRAAQWPGSRVISAQKANTANSFSLDLSSNSNGSGQPNGLSLSTANLFSAVQPGGSLFGLQASNPVDTDVAYHGSSNNYGTANDPMVGEKIGGVNVFGGGLTLYATGHLVVGGLGVSGDTSCADHFIAWRLRHALGFDHMGATNALAAVPGPASLFGGDPTHPDNIIFDISPNPSGGVGVSASGFGHPTCLNTGNQKALPDVAP
ncbi:MAG TPA: heme-binding protein [Bryobacteraceae bacterium]|nr:heme-binding protein [Bryobacteraceae bacterium]